MTNAREILSLDRLARAFEDYTEAAKSDAGKELRKEALALQQSLGGASRLAQADEILDGARLEAQQIINAAGAEIEKRRSAFDTEMARKSAELAGRKTELDARSGKLDGVSNAILEREQAVANRENDSKARERAVTVREADAKEEELRLANAASALAVREKAVSDRETRIRAAIG